MDLLPWSGHMVQLEGRTNAGNTIFLRKI